MKENDDKLRSLFQEIKLEEPSSGFESRLMANIHVIATKKTKKEIFTAKTFLAIGGAILGMLGIPALIFWWMGLPLKPEMQSIKHDYDISMPNLTVDPLVISVAVVCLLLLVGELLIRRRIWEKKHKD